MSLLGSVYPTSQAAYTGSNVRIVCYSIGVVQWIKNDLPSKNLMVERNALMIRNVTDNDSGIYTCRGYDHFGAVFTAESELVIGGRTTTKTNP